MLPLVDRKFLRALHRQTKQGPDFKNTFIEVCGVDVYGFCAATSGELGRLSGLIFLQAQCDGASRIQLRYGEERIIYTINGTDYEMLPPPAPLIVDLCRLLARTSKLRWEIPGKLKVPMIDQTLELMICHKKIVAPNRWYTNVHMGNSFPAARCGSATRTPATDGLPAYLEISGFNGKPRQLEPQ